MRQGFPALYELPEPLTTMSILEKLIHRIESGRPWSLGDRILTSVRGESFFYYFIDYDVNEHGQPVSRVNLSYYDLSEYLTWLIVHDRPAMDLVLSVLQEEGESSGEDRVDIDNIAVVLRAENPRQFELVSRMPDLSDFALHALFTQIRRGSVWEAGNKEGWERFFFENDVYVFESGDPIVGEKALERAVVPTDAEAKAWLKGCIDFRLGILSGTGNTMSIIRSYVFSKKKANTLREAIMLH